jgi:hypothetical protein
LPAAGIEGEYALGLELEKDAFFFGSGRANGFLLWQCKLGPALYVQSSGTTEADDLTDQANRDDGADVPRRDFTGLDFTAWAYDLFRPHEPYAARGLHPSGVGINRYRRFADLSEEEREFLELQGRLTWLNLVDPQLVGHRAFRIKSPLGGGPLRFNASLGHQLTSFGYAVHANVFLQQSRVNALVVLSAYRNKERSFPALQTQVLRLPIPVGDRTLFVSPRVAAWLQPKDQSVRATQAQAGGLLGVRASLSQPGGFEPYVEIEAKTSGWVSGHVYLESNVSARIGLMAQVHLH